MIDDTDQNHSLMALRVNNKSPASLTPLQAISTLVADEEHLAVGGHRGLAAGGVVGQDRHHIAADCAELVASETQSYEGIR